MIEWITYTRYCCIGTHVHMLKKCELRGNHMINTLKSNLMTINQTIGDVGASHVHRGYHERFLQCLHFTVFLLIKYMQHKSATVSKTGSSSEVSGVQRNEAFKAEAEVHGILISANESCRHVDWNDRYGTREQQTSGEKEAERRRAETALWETAARTAQWIGNDDTEGCRV